MGPRTKHGHWVGNKPSSTYIIWQGMISRCTNPAAKDYPQYGGRGITMDPNWKNFINFLHDMGERPEGLQLDRKNNDGNYTKDNCRWITAKMNAQNRRSTRHITIDGVTKCLAAWCEAYNLRTDTVCRRINKLHWPQNRWFAPVTNKEPL